MKDLPLVLACDYDRTLTDMDLVLRPSTLEAMAEARAAGLRIVVVSGRDAAFLAEHLGGAVDLVVAENGAFVVEPDTGREEPLFKAWPGRAALDRLGFELDHGKASANGDIAIHRDLERAVREAGLACRLEANRDRIMVLPEGVDKAAGYLAALERLGVPPSRAAAVGDGENDVALLSAAGHRIAVANAVPELLAMAHEVTTAPGGDGVREWLLGRWLPRRTRAASAPRG